MKNSTITILMLLIVAICAFFYCRTEYYKGEAIRVQTPKQEVETVYDTVRVEVLAEYKQIVTDEDNTNNTDSSAGFLIIVLFFTLIIVIIIIFAITI